MLPVFESCSPLLWEESALWSLGGMGLENSFFTRIPHLDPPYGTGIMVPGAGVMVIAAITQYESSEARSGR
jgi:hypothetical protein